MSWWTKPFPTEYRTIYARNCHPTSSDLSASNWIVSFFIDIKYKLWAVPEKILFAITEKDCFLVLSNCYNSCSVRDFNLSPWLLQDSNIVTFLALKYLFFLLTTCWNFGDPVNGCQLLAGLFIPFCIWLVSYLFSTVSLCVINGTGLSLQCWEDVLSSLRDFYLFNFGLSRAVNNASQPATCTVFIISMQPQLSVEYLWVPAKCLWCYLFMLLLSIIHLFIYSWKN